MRCSSCFVLFASVYISEMEFCVFLVITADTFNFRNVTFSDIILMWITSIFTAAVLLSVL